MEESGCIEIIIRSGESGFKHLGFGAFMITEGKEQANMYMWRSNLVVYNYAPRLYLGYLTMLLFAACSEQLATGNFKQIDIVPVE